MENEKRMRQKVEKQKADLMKELEDLHERLEEQGGIKDAQVG